MRIFFTVGFFFYIYIYIFADKGKSIKMSWNMIPHMEQPEKYVGANKVMWIDSWLRYLTWVWAASGYTANAFIVLRSQCAGRASHTGPCYYTTWTRGDEEEALSLLDYKFPQSSAPVTFYTKLMVQETKSCFSHWIHWIHVLDLSKTCLCQIKYRHCICFLFLFFFSYKNSPLSHAIYQWSSKYSKSVKWSIIMACIEMSLLGIRF